MAKQPAGVRSRHRKAWEAAVAFGRANGGLTYSQLEDHLPRAVSSVDEIDAWIQGLAGEAIELRRDPEPAPPATPPMSDLDRQAAEIGGRVWQLQRRCLEIVFATAEGTDALLDLPELMRQAPNGAPLKDMREMWAWHWERSIEVVRAACSEVRAASDVASKLAAFERCFDLHHVLCDREMDRLEPTLPALAALRDEVRALRAGLSALQDEILEEVVERFRGINLLLPELREAAEQGRHRLSVSYRGGPGFSYDASTSIERAVEYAIMARAEEVGDWDRVSARLHELGERTRRHAEQGRFGG